MIDYRDAAPADAPALAAFLRERFASTFGHLYPSEDLAAFLAQSYGDAQQRAQITDPQAGHRLAMQGGAILGAAEMGPMGLPIAHPPEERACELKRLYLADAVKGAGVADVLMNWAVDWAASRGAKVMYLGVWSENTRAQRFYARHGFVQVGTYEFPVGATRDLEWIMRLSLA